MLLGPQRFRPCAPRVLADLAVAGDVAVVTAGWGEREDQDEELRRLLPGAPVNLRLYGRWRDVVDTDRDFALADRRRRDRHEELQSLYLARLHHAIAAVRELWEHDGDDRLRSDAVDDAVEAVRDLDRRHLDRIAEIDHDFHARWPPHERPVVARHRREIGDAIGAAGAVAVAGGHVEVLSRCLHLFNVASALGDRPVVAWSAGAMAVTERIVLFHDFAPHGPGHAELHGRGLGLVRDVVALPHARRRLAVDEVERMRLIARRFAPARLVPMDGGTEVVCDDGVCGPAPLVDREGAVRWEAVA